MIPEPILERLLTSGAERIQGVLELLSEPNVPELIESFLEGVKTNGYSCFWPPERFQSKLGSKSAPHHSISHVYLLLLLNAPEPRPIVSALSASLSRFELRWLSTPWTQASFPNMERFSRLDTLDLQGMTVRDLSGLARAPALRTIRLLRVKLPEDLQSMGALSQVKTLHIDSPQVRLLSGLEGMDSLEELELEEVTITDLRSLPKLERLVSLSVKEVPSLKSLSGIERAPNLKKLQLSGGELEDIAPLAELKALEQLSISRSTANLKSLAGLPKAPELSKLSLNACPALTDLSGLQSSPKVTSFSLYQAHALSALEGLGRLSNLEQLKLAGLTQDLDLAPITKLQKLQVLDLRHSPGVTQIDALNKLDSLKLILLHESGVTRRAVSQEHRWRCSWAKAPDIKTLLEKAKPPPKSVKALQSKDKTNLTKIRKLLKSDKLENIDQALELLRTLKLAGHFDTLLKGAEYRNLKIRSKRLGKDRMQLVSSTFSSLTASYVLYGLLWAAPKDSEEANALKAQLQLVDLLDPSGPSTFAKPRPLPVHFLSALPRMKKLRLFQHGPLLVDEAKVGTFKALEAFEARLTRDPLMLDWLEHCPKLQHVFIEKNASWDGSMKWAAQTKLLQSIRVQYEPRLQDLSPLQGHPELRSVELCQCTALKSLAGLHDLPKLERLKIFYCKNLESLEELKALPKLEELVLTGERELKGLDPVQLPALKNVWLRPWGQWKNQVWEQLKASGVALG